MNEDEETTKFLNLYENERILWDKSDPNYHSLHERLSARERIGDAMGLGVEKVGKIFNDLRTAYLEEVRKVSENADYAPILAWFDVMATIMSQVSSNSATMAEEDVPCDVCKTTESEPNNDMVFCERCNICIHQACYGIIKIPKGAWYCKTCELEIEPPCLFCLKTKGAMKRTTEGKWVHVSCTLWIPEVTFGDSDMMEPIVDVGNIPKLRWTLTCSICHRKGGACIQCYLPKCKSAYHVTCAYENNLYMEIEDIETSESEIKFESFCKKHTELLRNKTSIEHSAKKPKTKKENFANDDEIFAQFLPGGANLPAISPDVPMTDVSGAGKTTAKNRNRFQMAKRETELSHEAPTRTYIGTTLVSKGTARKSLPAPPPTKKIKKKARFSAILLNNVQAVKKQPSTTKKPRVRNKVPKGNSEKSKANQTSVTKPAQSELQPPSGSNDPGTSLKNAELDEQPQSSKTPQKVTTPNPSESSVPTIRKLFPTPENQPKSIAIQNEHQGLLAGSEPTTSSNHHPSSESGDQSPPIGRRNQSVSSNRPSSTEIGLQTTSRSDNLDAFLGYMASLLRVLPLKKSLKIQNKLISQVLKAHDLSSSSEDVSDVSSMSD